MADLSKLGGSTPVEVAHRENVAEGLITRAPTSEIDSLIVVVPGYSTEFGYTVPAGNWSPRGAALPTVNTSCVVAFDDNGDCWVLVWQGIGTGLPVAGDVPIGTVIEYAGVGAPGPGNWQACDGSSLLRAGTYAGLLARLSLAKGAATVTIASPGVWTLTTHGLAIGDPVFITTTGALPTGLTASIVYYVMTVPNANTFTLGTTRTYDVAGAPTVTTAVNTTGTQSGIHTVTYLPWGAADATHFNVPNFNGKGAISPSGSHAHGSSGGEETHTLSAAESGLPAHSHTAVAAGAHNHTPAGGGNFAFNIGGGTADFVAGANYFITATTSTAPDHTHTINANGAAAASAAHNNLPPFVAIPRWIRYA